MCYKKDFINKKIYFIHSTLLYAITGRFIIFPIFLHSILKAVRHSQGRNLIPDPCPYLPKSNISNNLKERNKLFQNENRLHPKKRFELNRRALSAINHVMLLHFQEAFTYPKCWNQNKSETIIRHCLLPRKYEAQKWMMKQKKKMYLQKRKLELQQQQQSRQMT